jgi:Transposase DDE domain
MNNKGDGTLFDRSEFTYQPESDTFLCPAGQALARKQLSRKDRAVYYAGQPEVCGSCALKSKCTTGSRRWLTRHLHDAALQRMQQRTTPEVMQLRRSTVEHPFANLKYRIFGHPRFLLRGLQGAQTEISLAVVVYNLKRMRNILGGRKLTAVLQTA